MENYIPYIIGAIIVLVVGFISYKLYVNKNGDYTSENPAHPSGGSSSGGNEEIKRDDFIDRKGNSLVDQHRRRNNR